MIHKDTCVGDSGGPIWIQTDSEQIVLLAIVQGGKTVNGLSCGGSSSYATSLSNGEINDWVQKVMNS